MKLNFIIIKILDEVWMVDYAEHMSKINSGPWNALGSTACQGKLLIQFLFKWGKVK